jgi:hypothetical protein
MLHQRYIFRKNFWEKYNESFQNYAIKTLYPDIKTAQEYLDEEE